jgi:Spy/CpxP family protein refolding chaperone
VSSDQERTPEDVTPVPPPRRARVQAAMVLVTVAFVAFLAGAATDRWYLHRGREPGMRGGPGAERMMRGGPPGERGMRGPRRPSERMARDLGLSDAQRVQIDSIIVRQAREMRALMEAGQPRVDSILARTRVAIGQVLTAEQRVKFDSLVQARERDAPWSRRGGRRGPGRPPGEGGER